MKYNCITDFMFSTSLVGTNLYECVFLFYTFKNEKLLPETFVNST